MRQLKELRRLRRQQEPEGIKGAELHPRARQAEETRVGQGAEEVGSLHPKPLTLIPCP